MRDRHDLPPITPEANADFILGLELALGHCVCNEDRRCEPIGFLTVHLDGGAWTEFDVLKCGKCGLVSGFPDENLAHAIRNGTLATRKQLREIFHKNKPYTIPPTVEK